MNASKKGLRQFDSYALKTVKNYMYNCRFSFYVRNNLLTFDDFIEKIEKLVDLQDETNIHNFHPFIKAISYLLSLIRNQIAKGEDILVIKKEKKYLDKIMQYLNDSYKWCIKYQFYPFQLMYNECIFPVKELNATIFSPSSFCRPIKYSELSEQMNNYKYDINAIDNEIRLYEERLKVIELKNDIDKSKKTYIQILVAFASIITFLVGCISIFTNVETPPVPLYDKIEHIVLLGTVLLLFVNAVYFLTTKFKDKENKYTLNFWFFITTAILYIAVLIKYLIIA